MLGCQNKRGKFEVAGLSFGVYIGLSYMVDRLTHLYKLALPINATAFGVRANYVIFSCKHPAFHESCYYRGCFKWRLNNGTLELTFLSVMPLVFWEPHHYSLYAFKIYCGSHTN